MIEYQKDLDDQPTDVRYKRKIKQNKSSSWNNSLSEIRSPYNSSYITSTWEQKAQLSSTNTSKNMPKSKSIPTKQAFNYVIEEKNRNSGDLINTKGCSNQYKREKVSYEKYKDLENKSSSHK